MQMKKILLYTFLAGLLFTACEKMNDKHDKYLENGEIVYVGTIDSLKSFSGNDRIMFRYWLGDPRVKTLVVYWSNMKESYSIPIEPHAAEESFDVVIDGVSEGNHTFQWISYDDKEPKNKSILFEKNANVYGSRFQSRITNKINSGIEVSGSDLVVNWASPTNTQDIGINVTYTNNSGESKTEYFSNEDLLYEWMDAGIAKKKHFCTLPLTDINFSKGVYYNTLYLPEPNSIDTFYTSQSQIAIDLRNVNVALNKPVTSNSILNNDNAYRPENAVDGNYASTAARFITAAGAEHWIEIDLQGTYPVKGFAFWNGASNAYQLQGLVNFKFQVWKDNDWEDVVVITDNDTPTFSANFDPVSTSKVRFYSVNQIRFYEIMVYCDF